MTENQALQQENRQLSSLLKDYESTLEAVMGKFRAHAVSVGFVPVAVCSRRPELIRQFLSHFSLVNQHATQQHHLDLTRHYESLLLSMPVSIPPPADIPPDPSNPEAPPIDPEHLQLSLSHLASLIRKALRAMQGEDPEDSTSPLLLPMGIGEATSALSDALRTGSQRPRDGSEATDDDSAGPPSPTSSIRSFSSIASSAAAAPPSATGSETDLDRLLASHHPSTSRSRALESEGGYVSRLATTDPHYVPTTSVSSLVMTPPRPGQARPVQDEMAARGLGPLDEALQRDVELEALRRENEELKKLLRISEMELDDERDSLAAMTAVAAAAAGGADSTTSLKSTLLEQEEEHAERETSAPTAPEQRTTPAPDERLASDSEGKKEEPVSGHA